MDLYVIIVAGGSGKRMGSEIPKQFLPLSGTPVLARTFDFFRKSERHFNIILVLPAGHKDLWKDWCMKENISFRHIIAEGGITRFHSVRNALEYVPEGAIVLVHDGVRPFVTEELASNVIRKIEEGEKAAIPVIPVYDSIRRRTPEGGSVPEDRSALVSVQTPQAFDSTTLKKAYSMPYRPEFTDDASVVEQLGIKICLCPGYRYNIKITDPEDLKLAGLIAGTAGSAD